MIWWPCFMHCKGLAGLAACAHPGSEWRSAVPEDPAAPTLALAGAGTRGEMRLLALVQTKRRESFATSSQFVSCRVAAVHLQLRS